MPAPPAPRARLVTLATLPWHAAAALALARLCAFEAGAAPRDTHAERVVWALIGALGVLAYGALYVHVWRCCAPAARDVQDGGGGGGAAAAFTAAAQRERNTLENAALLFYAALLSAVAAAVAAAAPDVWGAPLAYTVTAVLACVTLPVCFAGALEY